MCTVLQGKGSERLVERETQPRSRGASPSDALRVPHPRGSAKEIVPSSSDVGGTAEPPKPRAGEQCEQALATAVQMPTDVANWGE